MLTTEDFFFCWDISIHALHEESDWEQCVRAIRGGVFQSTLSMRRATRPIRKTHHTRHISIHALHEESDHELYVRSSTCPISIHALHEESDPASDGQVTLK